MWSHAMAFGFHSWTTSAVPASALLRHCALYKDKTLWKYNEMIPTLSYHQSVLQHIFDTCGTEISIVQITDSLSHWYFSQVLLHCDIGISLHLFACVWTLGPHCQISQNKNRLFNVLIARIPCIHTNTICMCLLILWKVVHFNQCIVDMLYIENA